MDCGLSGLTFTRPSLTESQFNDECDISNIVHRFLRSGQLPALSDRPILDDATKVPSDYFELQDAILRARNVFDSLPLEMRNKFHNNPEEYFNSLVEHPAEPSHESPADPLQEPPAEPPQEPPASAVA